MTRTQRLAARLIPAIAVALLALVAVAVLVWDVPVVTAEIVIAWWLAQHAGTVVIWLAVWVGISVLVGVVWALTYGWIRRPHRGRRAVRHPTAGHSPLPAARRDRQRYGDHT